MKFFFTSNRSEQTEEEIEKTATSIEENLTEQELADATGGHYYGHDHDDDDYYYHHHHHHHHDY